nr:MAG TPA: KilAC domain protein [Caudoviricetes sp.]
MPCVCCVKHTYGGFLFIIIRYNMLDTTNELIPNQKGMTSLQIAEVTGKRHDAILRDIRNLLKQGVAAHNFVETSYTDKSNRQSPCFNLTPKGCLILASGYDAVLRERIINRLEYLENEKKVIKTPQTYLEALEALVASEKEKEQLRIETEQQQKQIEQKDAKITKLQPKADFAEAAFKAEGKVDIGQAAKILNLGFGRNTLFGKLRDAGIFFKDRNEPKQKYIDAGYFEMTLLPPIRRDNHPDILCQKVFANQKVLPTSTIYLAESLLMGKLQKSNSIEA